MKIICSKNNLLNSINISLKAVASKSTMPILECIYIDATEDKIKLVSNDTELGIETIVEGNIIEAGQVALKGRFFGEIIKKIPDNEITISVDENYLVTIKSDRSKFDMKIHGQSGEDFILLPSVEKEKNIEISQFTLKEMIRQTIFSIAINETNPMMTGELLSVENNNLKMVSLDGHRIAIRKMELKNNYDDMKVIVPGKTLNEISKILSGESDDIVNLYFSKNHILFELDNTIVVSRLIEGDYYKIEQMLSLDYETKIQVNRQDFLDCLDRSLLLVRENEKKPVVINIKDEKMELEMKTSTGSMNEEILINKDGKNILIGFNPKFLIDALKVIDDENISIYLVNPKAPCFIRDDNDKYTYLILPVNIVQNR